MEFQFLIGTIKTCYISNMSTYSLQFQFLIGTIKTGLKNVDTTTKKQFQFLIGTIKTYFIKAMDYGPSQVSIPYRYYKNFSSSQPATFIAFLFQFLIGTIKTGIHHI